MMRPDIIMTEAVSSRKPRGEVPIINSLNAISLRHIAALRLRIAGESLC